MEVEGSRPKVWRTLAENGSPGETGREACPTEALETREWKSFEGEHKPLIPSYYGGCSLLT
jgi:hypothetical protein